MSTSAISNREAAGSVRVLLFATVATMIIGVMSGILQTYILAQLTSGNGSTAIAALSLPRTTLHVMSLLGYAAFVYGLYGFYRSSLVTSAATPALLAVLLRGLSLLVSVGYLIAPDSAYRLVGGNIGMMGTFALLLVGDAMLLVALARRSGRRFDLAMGGVLGLLVFVEIAVLLLYRSPFHGWIRENAWAFLAIRQPFTLAATGLLIYVLARAARDLATLQGDAAATEVAESATHDSDAQSGQRMMVSGAIWLVGGLIVTIASYTLASSAGGGRFVLAYGAVIYGIAQIFRGMSRSAK